MDGINLMSDNEILSLCDVIQQTSYDIHTYLCDPFVAFVVILYKTDHYWMTHERRDEERIRKTDAQTLVSQGHKSSEFTTSIQSDSAGAGACPC
jgi:hypothetical protein